MFFDNIPTAQEKSCREVLSCIPPKDADDIKMVAAALKTRGSELEFVFLEWATPFGRYKSKHLWAKARPDPDALEEVLMRHIAAKAKRSRFDPQTAKQLEATAIPGYRIKGVLPDVGLAAVYGASGSAKSFLCLHAAGSIARGTSFFGHRTSIAPVLYIALEGEAGYRGRVAAWQRHHGCNMPDEVRFLLQPFRLTNPQDVTDLAAICPPGVVIIIDTLNRAAPGTDENSSKDMGQILEGAKTLQRLTGGLVILVAHTGKDATKGLRGHSSLIAALDAAIFVERVGDARTWKLEKAKDGEDGATHGFCLNSVALGIDTDGEEIASAVVVPVELSNNVEAKPLTGNRRIALAAFHDVITTSGCLTDEGTFKGVPLEAWRKRFYETCPAENDEAKRKAFNRARADLVECNELQNADDFYSAAGINSNLRNEAIAKAIANKRDMSRTIV